MDATESIKTCGYCGRENAAAALNCRECGTAFEQEQSGEVRQILKSPFAKSSAAIAIATGLAAFLISTGVFCAFGSTPVEQANLPKNPFLTAAMALGMVAIPLLPGCLVLVPAFMVGMTLDSFAIVLRCCSTPNSHWGFAVVLVQAKGCELNITNIV